MKSLQHLGWQKIAMILSCFKPNQTQDRRAESQTEVNIFMYSRLHHTSCLTLLWGIFMTIPHVQKIVPTTYGLQHHRLLICRYRKAVERAGNVFFEL
jgi:hypothetical protein